MSHLLSQSGSHFEITNARIGRAPARLGYELQFDKRSASSIFGLQNVGLDLRNGLTSIALKTLLSDAISND